MSNTYAPTTPPSAYQLEKSVAAWQQLQDKLVADQSLTDDEYVVRANELEAMPLALPEGGTVPHPRVLLERAIDAVIWCDRRVEEADNLRKRHTSRRDRYAERADAIRKTIVELLDILSLKECEATEGSAAMRARPASVVITDPDKLPLDCVKVVTTPLIRDVIAPKLKRGESVPGAALSNPTLGLTILPF